MIYALRQPFIWATVLVFGYWYLGSVKQQDFPSFDDLISYTVEDCHNDMSRIYYDLGNLSLRRGDFSRALVSFSKALKYNSHLLPASDKLKFVYKQLGSFEQADKIRIRAFAFNKSHDDSD
jgi:tetratricopeptide (TPR) repeat protein